MTTRKEPTTTIAIIVGGVSGTLTAFHLVNSLPVVTERQLRHSTLLLDSSQDSHHIFSFQAAACFDGNTLPTIVAATFRLSRRDVRQSLLKRADSLRSL